MKTARSHYGNYRVYDEHGRNIPDPGAWLLPGGRLTPLLMALTPSFPLARSVEGQFFFAREATHRAHPATVHGAYLSGRRAAGEVRGG